MASVNQTRPHCVNQMGKTHSKPLAARHGGGTAWAQHVMCESACSIRAAPERAWKLKFALDSARDAIFKNKDILSAAPRPFALQTFSSNSDVLGNISWQAHSPDLSACDIFLWQKVKVK